MQPGGSEGGSLARLAGGAQWPLNQTDGLWHTRPHMSGLHPCHRPPVGLPPPGRLPMAVQPKTNASTDLCQMGPFMCTPEGRLQKLMLGGAGFACSKFPSVRRRRGRVRARCGLCDAGDSVRAARRMAPCSVRAVRALTVRLFATTSTLSPVSPGIPTCYSRLHAPPPCPPGHLGLHIAAHAGACGGDLQPGHLDQRRQGAPPTQPPTTCAP